MNSPLASYCIIVLSFLGPNNGWIRTLDLDHWSNFQPTVLTP